MNHYLKSLWIRFSKDHSIGSFILSDCKFCKLKLFYAIKLFTTLITVNLAKSYALTASWDSYGFAVTLAVIRYTVKPLYTDVDVFGKKNVGMSKYR